jgi:hypothetical protein
MGATLKIPTDREFADFKAKEDYLWCLEHRGLFFDRQQRFKAPTLIDTAHSSRQKVENAFANSGFLDGTKSIHDPRGGADDPVPF